MESKNIIRLEDIIRSRSSFNVIEVAKIIAELVGKVENGEYVPMTCHNRSYQRYRTYVAVVEKYLFEEEKMYANVTPECWVHNSFNYGPYIGVYYSDVEDEDVDNKDITVSFNSSLKVPEKYSYINKFMEYLITLQLAKGERLTYEEMQEALNEFIRFEKRIFKQKIKRED